MIRLISVAEFRQIQFISAKVASVKVNKTKVPAFLCSLDVGPSLLEVQLTSSRDSLSAPCTSWQRHSVCCVADALSDVAAYVLYCFDISLALEFARGVSLTLCQLHGNYNSLCQKM